jgi:hypothetical protein
MRTRDLLLSRLICRVALRLEKREPMPQTKFKTQFALGSKLPRKPETLYPSRQKGAQIHFRAEKSCFACREHCMVN